MSTDVFDTGPDRFLVDEPDMCECLHHRDAHAPSLTGGEPHDCLDEFCRCLEYRWDLIATEMEVTE